MWERKERREGAFMLKMVCLVCEGQVKFPGGF